MSAVQAIGGGFSLDRTGLGDESPFVLAATTLSADREAMPLLLVADPVEPVPGAGELAADILHGMAVFLRHTLDHDVNSSLVTAFRTANERVYEENRTRNGMRRVYLGLSCVVLRGDELWVAQCAPSQVLVWQDGLLHAIPSLHTWTAEHITETFSELSYPLGFHTSVHPRISYSRCAPGDMVAVVSWPIARELSSVASLHNISSLQTFNSMMLANLDGANSSLALHGAAYEISSATASSQSSAMRKRKLPHPMDSQKLPLDATRLSGDSRNTNRNSRQYDRRFHPDDDFPTTEWRPNSSIAARDFDTLGSGQFCNHGTDDLPDIRFRGRDSVNTPQYVNLATSPANFTPSGQSEPSNPAYAAGPEQRYPVTDVRAHRSRRPAKRKGYLVEIFAGLLLSLTAAVVGVWQVTKRDRPIHGPRDDGTLGLPHLQRWSDSYHPPRFDRIRRVSPRFQFNGIAIAVVVALIVVLLGALVYGQVVDRMQERSATIDDELQNIAAVRTEAESAPAGESTYESLVGAQVALDDLEATATSDEALDRIHEEQATVGELLDTLTAVERVSSVQVMGSVPPAPDGVVPRLFEGDGRVFIFSGGLFELDRTSGSLVHLLTEGDLVGGTEVGMLIAAGWNEDRPLAVDANNAYLLEPSTGIWHRVALGSFSEQGNIDIGAVSIFDRNIYALAPESGQILKFDALDFGNTPEDWTAGGQKEELQEAVDLVVDGRIHVALRDGTVLTFFRSALERSFTAQVAPPLESVSALTALVEGERFFLVNESDGRIAYVDAEGNVLRQYVIAEDAPSLAGATDLVVNLTDGISHVIVGDTLYAVRLGIPE